MQEPAEALVEEAREQVHPAKEITAEVQFQ
jgi:hypothetical protein